MTDAACAGTGGDVLILEEAAYCDEGFFYETFVPIPSHVCTIPKFKIRFICKVNNVFVHLGLKNTAWLRF